MKKRKQRRSTSMLTITTPQEYCTGEHSRLAFVLAQGTYQTEKQNSQGHQRENQIKQCIANLHCALGITSSECSFSKEH